MKTILNIEELDDPKKLLEGYKYQKELTSKLDAIQGAFTQDIVNEIVLWKVNRYAQLSEKCLGLLNTITNESDWEKETNGILEQLLITPGIRLPMASTILRFKAPLVYQIFDQRVYRYLYGTEYNSTVSVEKQIQDYKDYIRLLKEKCDLYHIPFVDADRILYLADKEHNKELKIKY